MNVLLCAGCQEYRIEHHKRPAFYEKASAAELTDEVTLEDGTVIKYSSNQIQSSYGRTGDDRHKPFLIREESEDGKTITLRAMLPGHVLVNTLTCVRNEEYQLLWDQMLSERTKQEYEKNNEGFEEFEEAFRKNRHDFTATLTRMVAGLPHEQVSMTPQGNGITRCKLRPQIAEPFKFKIVDVIKEGQQMKLLIIR